MTAPTNLRTSDIRAAVRAGRSLDAALPLCDVAGRIGRMRGSLGSSGAAIDALLVTDLVNIRYLCGFTGSAGRLLVPVDASTPALFVTDGRYEERAAHELRSAGLGTDQVAVVVGRTAAAQDAALRAYLGGTGPGHTRCVGLEASSVSWAALDSYRAGFPGWTFNPTNGLVEGLRRTKDTGEIARLSRASAIADTAFDAVMGRLGDRPTEAEFARELEGAMVARGAEGVSFDTIIAAGPPGSEPHHRTGDRRIERGDAVICDFGALFDGYHSDMTRTVHVGSPDRRQRRHFEAVRISQAEGAERVRAGVAAKDIDAACRAALRRFGWVRRFVHGTGHGIGLVIHESPWLGASSTATLAVADVVTVEPGVYLPGIGGVRVEDSMIVTSSGSIPITLTPKELVVG